jgi:segregation and condensation protein A
MGCAGAEKVLEHLMFHKAMIDEDDRAVKIDHYLSVLEDGEAALAPRDPLDRSLETVFELVLSNDLDPWDIDLMKFSRLYADKVKEEDVNFVMAWSILRMQSEGVLQRSERREEELECWDPDFFDVMDEEPRVRLCMPEEVDLDEVVRHKGFRPVTLMELLDAFEDANRERELNERRERARAANRAKLDKFDTKAHNDDMEKDVDEVWRRIQQCGPGAIRLEDIWLGGKEDLIMVFVSLLFLARSGKISVWQEDLPFGPISVEVRMDWDIGTLEDVPPMPMPTAKDREAVM